MSQESKRKMGRISAAANAVTAVPSEDEIDMGGEDMTENHDDSEIAEDEYEVETIIEHRVDEKGNYSYLVSWKGYSAEHNTWEPEDHIHADNILSDYWKRQSNGKGVSIIRKGKGRQSTSSETPTKRQAAIARAAPSPKRIKRGSVDTAKAATGGDEVDEIAEVDDVGEVDDDHKLSEPPVDPIEKYMHLTSWEDAVEAVETVERNGAGDLLAYLLMEDGERITVTTAFCRERLPQKMLEFYESHLKWRTYGDT